VVKTSIYKFWFDGGEFFMEIEAERKVVEKLLDEYRKLNEEYNDEGWLRFLRNKGIKARFIKLKASIYF
jgi:hypothetical protein